LTSERVERRLAAVLAADVAGYSRLMGTDEEGTLARLKAFRKNVIDLQIANHRGRIVKTTGDGMLVEFASAVGAVRCAVEIQRDMAVRNSSVPQDTRIEFRIGIHVGDIIIDDDDIFGDGVNIAARLEGIAEPGGICISDDAHRQIRGKVDIVSDDLGLQKLKNIAEPIRAYSVGSHDKAGAIAKIGDTSPKTKAMPRKRHFIVVAGMASALALGIAVVWWQAEFFHRQESLLEKSSLASKRPTIAILPFIALDAAGGSDYFAEGLTQDIIADVGRFRDLSVLSLAAASSYKKKNLPAEQIGHDLNVRYVLDGTVRRSPERIRISVNLSDTSNSSVRWSEKYDVEAREIFSVQDQITRRISGALAVRVATLELETFAARAPSSMEAYDLVLRGRDLVGKITRSTNAEARTLFERAIQLDPTYAPAYVGLGRVDRNSVIQGWDSNPTEALKRAEALARKAIALDNRSPGAHALLGQVLVQFGDYDRALDELRRAIDLNGSDVEAYSGLVAVLLWRGDVKDAVAAGEIMHQFQPELSATDAFMLATAYVLTDRGSDAVRLLQQSLDGNPMEPNTNIMLAAAYAETGRQTEAERQSAIVRQRFPWFSVEEFGSLLRDKQLQEKLQINLKQAGL
jgi:class 3 adenylate cyclase/TolB-like protein/thioredoxin-like negative regulator of GroEL